MKKYTKICPSGNDTQGATKEEKVTNGIFADNIITQVYAKWEELEEAVDPDKFCYECPFITIQRDREEFWGATCYREYPDCPAEFNPEEKGCPRAEEYAELSKEYNEVKAKLDKLFEEEEA